MEHPSARGLISGLLTESFYLSRAAGVFEFSDQARDGPAPTLNTSAQRCQNRILVLQINGRDNEVVARRIVVNALRLDQLEGEI